MRDDDQRSGKRPPSVRGSTLGDSTPTADGPGWPTPPVPPTIGDYRIVGKLGEGGMGIVYEAEQRSPKRKVALKVVRGGQFVDELHLKMFRREIETLARLKHPNIGAIYESDRTEDGQHFFTMELVRGETLDAHLDRHPGPHEPAEIERRLLLFRKIADAVHYAHQRGVIHRDLKPANVIVLTDEASGHNDTPAFGVPEVKILDFGLARLVDADMGEATMLTEAGTIRGTLGYMSPEQTQGDPEIDVRVDVYALGVILYEMLTGARPYETEQTRLIDAVRVICDEPPKSLAASWQGTRRPDSDLETIIHKALEKEPDRRYASAAALSEDIDRYLGSQPIQARPPSAAYQLRKLVERHKLSFAFAVTLGLLVLGFGVGMSVLYARAVEAEGRATSEAKTAESALNLILAMFRSPDPYESRGGEHTARQALEQGAEQIESQFADQPEVHARLIATVGWVYRGLGLYDKAVPLLERALEIRREIHGANHRQTWYSMNDLAVLYADLKRYDEAERLHDEAYRAKLAVLGPEHRDTLRSMSNLAFLLEKQGRYDEAERLHTGTLEIQRRALPPDDPETLRSMNNLAVVYQNLARYEQAEALIREALAGRRRALGAGHPETLASLNNLAVFLHARGRVAEAEPLYRESLAAHREILGEEHPTTLTALYNFGNFYLERDRPDEAEPLLREAFDKQQRTLGDADPDTLDTLYNLACASALLGRRAAAIDYLNRALDRGYDLNGNPAGILTDADLRSLHGDPAFAGVARRIRQLAASR